MTSLNRPNAPSRLPIDAIEQSFFKPWALRHSRADSSSPDRSPLSDSPISFNTIQAQSKAKRIDRRRNLSETAPKSALAYEVTTTSTTLGSNGSGILEHDFTLRRRRASAESVLSRRESSGQSSASSRTGKMLNIPGLRIAPNATKDGQPPRKAKKGFKWKQEISGHWLEIRTGRKSRSGEQSLLTESDATPPVISTVPTGFGASERGFSNAAGSEHTAGDPFLPPSDSGTGTPGSLIWVEKEGLYCRTKRALGLKRTPIGQFVLEPGEKLVKTPTGDMLNRAASLLRDVTERRQSPSSSATSVSNMSIAAAPHWKHLRLGYRGGQSSSSSVRSLLMGRPPAPTPEPQELYTAADDQQYERVEMTDPDGPAYLPSEARRMHTPPLSNEGSISSSGRLRGFFTDYNAPRDDNVPRKDDVPTTSGKRILYPNRKTRDEEWSMVKLDAIHPESTSREQFVLSVPEHLPNSPLCPRNPKHRLGGTGVCIYHSRKRTFPLILENPDMN